MEHLHKWLSEYVAYFGIIAAIVALGSWLTTNYYGTRANSARDALKEAKGAFENASRFRRVYQLVNEETQNLDHVYDLMRKLLARMEEDPRASGKRRRELERYEWLKRLEYARHGDRSIYDEVERAAQLVEYSDTLNVGGDVAGRARSAYDEVTSLSARRQNARKELAAQIDAAGKIYELGESEWTELVEKMKRYRETVEISLIPAQNEASQKIANLESEVVGLQARETARRKKTAIAVQRIAFTLYVASALLALYGKWLEVRYPKQGGKPVTVAAVLSKPTNTTTPTNR